MTTIRNTSGWDLDTPFGTCDADALLTVPATAVYGFTASANWEPNDAEAQDAHDAAAKAEREAVGVLVVDDEPAPASKVRAKRG